MIASIARNMKSSRVWTTSGRRPWAAAPTAIPAKAFSQLGMSRTRLGPKRFIAADVVP